MRQIGVMAGDCGLGVPNTSIEAIPVYPIWSSALKMDGQSMLPPPKVPRSLSCVNFVGVDLNTASPTLLRAVAGLGPALAKAIVKYRDEKGAFPSRQALLSVPRFGAKAFEQAAGFLRIRGGGHPLDNSAVHPERYPVVEAMAADLGASLAQLVADPLLSARIDLKRYVTEQVGLPTLRDILEELKKPGRDPRSQFQAASFRDDMGR